MKLNFNKRDTTMAVYAFLVLAAAILFHGLLSHLSAVAGVFSMVFGLLAPFIYAFGIAYILNPILKFIERALVAPLIGKHASGKFMRGLSVLLTFLFAAGIIAVFTMIVIPQLIASITGLVYKLSRYLNSPDTWIPRILAYFPDLDFDATISGALRQYADTIMNSAVSMMKQLLPWLVTASTSFASGLLSTVVGIIISIYMLLDKERFCAGCKKVWYAILPQQRADWLLDLTAQANRVFGGFISGKILDSLIIGILCFLGMSLLGMPSAMLVSVIVGVTNVIPYFGPFIGAIPSFFILLIDAPVKALWFLVFILILQQFDGNVLGPKILGDSTGLSAFWVIFAIMLFGGLYGFIGMFLGVPVFSVVYMLIWRFVDARLGMRGMPVGLDSYSAPDSPIPTQSGKKPGMFSGTPIMKRGAHVSRVGPPRRKKEEPPEGPDGPSGGPPQA